MNVTIISWRELGHPGWGGSEVLVDKIAVGLANRGLRVSLLCAGPVGKRPYEVVKNGRRFSQYIRTPFVWHRLPRADVVIDVSNGIPFFASLWQRRPTICLVHHVHGKQWRDALPAPVAALGWFLERRVVPKIYRRFWSVSPSTTTSLLGIGVRKNKIREIQIGTDVSAARPDRHERSSTPLFVVIGRLVPHKGVGRILEAWREIGPQVGGELVVIGDGPQRAELEARATPATRFLGYVDEDVKADVLRRSWALVHGAYHEGWGLVVTEAAAVGVPSLAFCVPGVRDAVIDGSTGFLARDPAQLVELWLRLSNDPDLRAELGLKAWERASAMSWDAVAESVADMVAEIFTGSW